MASMCNDKFQRLQRRGTQSFQETIFAIAYDDIADAKQAAKHHVHAEDAWQYPVRVAYFLPIDYDLADVIHDRRV